MIIDETDIDALLVLISGRIRKLVQENREKELVLHNEPLRCQRTEYQLNLFKNDIDINWNSIKALKRIANKLRKDSYSEDETRGE